MPESNAVITATSKRARKLGTAHFAFMRGLVQGLPLRDMWQRYLEVEGSSSDQRVMRSTIQWIRDAFAAAARREDRFGTARLVLIDVTRLPEEAPAVPSLEEFAVARGLEDFCESEQVAAFEAEYGKASQRQSRRARLVAKQLDALRWLESLAAQPPRAGDAVAAWLNPSVSGRLNASGIFTLAQLVERINGLGQGWARSVPGIGPVKARRVRAWLIENGDTPVLRIGRHVALPRRSLDRRELQQVVSPATDVRPLEKLVVPDELDGSRGLYRRPQSHCLLSSNNDYQAILTWIQSKHGATPEQRSAANARRRGRDTATEGPLDWLQYLSHTQRAYRKEAERFLLWAVLEKGKPLSSMATEDCIEYRDFLSDPQPRARWCAPRNRERWSPLWRPFEGPLSPAARRQAITILKNLYAFWVDKNYVMGNPWSGVAVPRSSQPRLNSGRSLTMEQWRFVLGQREHLPDTCAARRLHFALPFLYATGLRLSEAIAARVDHLVWVECPPDEDDGDHVEGWLLRVVGKGGKEREVPVPIEVVSELSRYLVARGLDADPESAANRGAYLLGKATDLAAVAPALHKGTKIDPREGVASNTVYDQLKRFFADCARMLADRGDHKGAQRLERASTHWLRHTHASHSIARGTRLEIEQQILGHASLATTTVYVTTEKKRKLKAISTFYGK